VYIEESITVRYMRQAEINTYIHTYIHTQGNETLLPDWQKESLQTFEEASEHVRPERVKQVAQLHDR
jgi:hypothetical protein